MRKQQSPPIRITIPHDQIIKQNHRKKKRKEKSHSQFHLPKSYKKVQDYQIMNDYHRPVRSQLVYTNILVKLKHGFSIQQMKEPKSRITRILHCSPNRNTNVPIEANIWCIASHVRPSPSCLSNVAGIPNWSVQKHRLLWKSLTIPPLHFPHQLPINDPLYKIWTPLDHILMKPIRAIKTQIMNLFSVPSPCMDTVIFFLKTITIRSIYVGISIPVVK